MPELIKTLKATLCIVFPSFLFGVAGAWASSHGNDLVHSRTFGGQIYIMYFNHMSLYTNAKDPLGVSTCYDKCSEAWPPALLDQDADLGENYSLIQRKNGTYQAAFKGQPLYLSTMDKAPGETNGDGVEDQWFLARPDF